MSKLKLMSIIKGGSVMRWRSNPHPISDFCDWKTAERIELRPDFQRKEVWSRRAQIMLIDTILKNIPMPKLYIQAVIREKITFRSVIDGQQRLTAIFAFIKGDFTLSKPYTGEFIDKNFEDLPTQEQDLFLAYQLDTNEVTDATEEEIRELYSRVNKYIVPLNQQELRRADFPGDFLSLCEELALLPYFEDSKVFSVSSRRRMADVEYISELLSILISGPQNKKETLDNFYLDFSVWDPESMKSTQTHFEEILKDLELIFPNELFPISNKRFCQKADFYSLFAAIHELQLEGYSIMDKDLTLLRNDLKILDMHINPHSTGIFSDYAIKCVSEANTVGSRTWRKNVLKSILSGTYIEKVPDKQTLELFKEMLIALDLIGDPGDCHIYPECPLCHNEIIDYDIVTWHNTADQFQLENAVFVHKDCISHSDYLILDT